MTTTVISFRRNIEDDDRAVVDYVAGMTDLYAIRKAEEIDPGVASIFLEPRQ